METTINQFGETVTKWTSYKHPDDPDFMQLVNWTIWEKSDNRITIGYNLGSGSKTHFINGMTKQEAINKFL